MRIFAMAFVRLGFETVKFPLVSRRFLADSHLFVSAKLTVALCRRFPPGLRVLWTQCKFPANGALFEDVIRKLYRTKIIRVIACVFQVRYAQPIKSVEKFSEDRIKFNNIRWVLLYDVLSM